MRAVVFPVPAVCANPAAKLPVQVESKLQLLVANSLPSGADSNAAVEATVKGEFGLVVPIPTLPPLLYMLLFPNAVALVAYGIYPVERPLSSP